MNKTQARARMLERVAHVLAVNWAGGHAPLWTDEMEALAGADRTRMKEALGDILADLGRQQRKAKAILARPKPLRKGTRVRVTGGTGLLRLQQWAEAIGDDTLTSSVVWRIVRAEWYGGQSDYVYDLQAESAPEGHAPYRHNAIAGRDLTPDMGGLAR